MTRNEIGEFEAEQNFKKKYIDSVLYGSSDLADAIHGYVSLPSQNLRERYRKNILQIIYSWEDKGGYLDTIPYVHSVNTILPFLASDEILFLWNRAIKETTNQYSEHQYFGEIILANIVPYLPLSERKDLLIQIDIKKIRNNQTKAIILLYFSDFYENEIRLGFQREAWKYVCKTATTPQKSDFDRALSLEWSAENNTLNDNLWIDTIMSKFEVDLIPELWNKTISEACKDCSGEESRAELRALALQMPIAYIHIAFKDCFKLYSQSRFKEEWLVDTISRLIHRYPKDQQSSTLIEIIDWGMSLPRNTMNNPLDFVSELKKIQI